MNSNFEDKQANDKDNDYIQDEADEQSENIEDAINLLEAEFKLTPTIELANQLIAIYHELEDFASVRRIRETLLENMTLTEQQWLDWLDEEIINAKADEEKRAVLKLFEKALEDSLYFDVAKLCVKYTRKLFNDGVLRKQGAKIMLEKLVNKFCNDFQRGSTFLKKLKKFELASTDKPDSPETIKAIRNIYARLLKLPLADIYQTYEEYANWEKDEQERRKMIETFNTTFAVIGNHLDVDEKFVTALESGKADQITKVLQSIINEPNFTLERKMTYFERCFERYPTLAPAWELYVNFSRDNIKVMSVLEPILRRAYKNNPSNINYALYLLRAKERGGAEKLELEKTCLQMLTKFSNNYEFYMLWLYICEVNVRVINQRLIETKGNIEPLKEEIEHFRTLAQQAIEFFSSDAEANQQYIDTLHLFWANIEVYTLKDKSQMNKIMEKYIHQNGDKYQAWVQYISFEQILGKLNNVRSLIKRALEVTKDDIHSMFNYAIEFERKFGTLEDLENIEQRYKEKVARLSATTVVIADEQSMVSEVQPPKDVPGRPIKRRHEEMAKQQFDSAPIDVQEKIRDDKKIKGPDSTLRRPVFADKDRTVFVKGLPYSFTETDIRAIFTNMDKVTDCRILKDKDTGVSRGMAYVDFETVEDAKAALAQDGLEIDGRKLVIALSNPPKKGKNDEKTLFINNLPFTVDEDKIKELYHDYGDDIEEIRIPRNVTGQAKGYAYVVFKSRDKMEDALEKSKNMRMDNRKLIVEVADSSKHFEQVAKASTVIFMKGLDFAATEKDIEEFFKSHNINHIKQIHIPKKKKTNKSQGIAFVEFEYLVDYKKALGLKNPQILGRTFEIQKSDRPITTKHDEMEEEVREESKSNKNALSKKDVIEPEEQTPPRSLQSLSANFVPAQQQDNTSTTQTKDQAPTAPKLVTNADFKNLFKKK